jgi:hypothetical protein
MKGSSGKAGYKRYRNAAIIVHCVCRRTAVRAGRRTIPPRHACEMDFENAKSITNHDFAESEDRN